MTKVVFKSLKPERVTKAAPRAVAKKRTATSDGKSKTVLTLDANSSTFDEGLAYVFRKNVAKARRENKRLLGSPDSAPRKR